MKGTLLLAEEGINGTVSGSREGIDALFAWLRSDPRLADIEHKESYCDEQPFYRTKVKLKKEIVTLGVPGVDPNKQVGQYVEAKDWNALISDPEVLLIDTRNDYEVAIGTFEGAVDPNQVVPRVPRVHQGPLRPGAAQEGGDVLHRRHPLREGFQLHARRRFRGSLPPQGAASSSTSKRCRENRACGAATASYSTTA